MLVSRGERKLLFIIMMLLTFVTTIVILLMRDSKIKSSGYDSGFSKDDFYRPDCNCRDCEGFRRQLR